MVVASGDPAAVGQSASRTTAPLPASVPSSASSGGGTTGDSGGDSSQSSLQSSSEARASPASVAAPDTAFAAAAAAASGSPSAPAARLATSETLTRLTADIVHTVKAKASRIELALQPEGLGRVDVKLHIGADGALSAELKFDNPQAAAALKARADELRAALQQAGFDLSGSGLSFTAGGFSDGSAQRGAGGWAQNGSAFTALVAAAEADAETAPASALLSRPAGGLDLTI